MTLALVIVHALLLAWSAYRHSPTFDETAHLPSGLSHWEFRRFDLYSVNPPLVRMVAAFPIWLSNAKRDWSHYTNQHDRRLEFAVGRDFLWINGDRAYWYFTLARWACIPFSLLGMIVCSHWTRELYGDRAGLCAAVMWSFSPTMLGHGQLITPDVGAATTGLLAMYMFWKFMTCPAPRSAVLAGAALGVAWLTKSTLLVLGVVWPVLWLVDRFLLRRRAGDMPAPHALVLILLVALFVVHLGYGFEGSFTRLGDIGFASRLGVDSEGNQRWATHWIGNLPSPLPENYIRGIDRQKVDFEAGWESYLRGEWRKGGWWYYYLYGLAIKLPVGLLVLLSLGTPILYHRRPLTRDEWFVLVPAVAIITLVSSQTGFNHHVRYVLPAIPYLFILACRVFCEPDREAIGADRNVSRSRWTALERIATLGAVGWFVASSLSVYPHSLSYFNEFVGGPRNGHRHLLNSNIDWGQDLLYLREWIERHPDARPIYVAYFPSWQVRPLLERLPVEPLSGNRVAPGPGWYAVSLNELYGKRDDLRFLRELQPIDRAGYSILIFRVSAKEIRQAKRR